MIMKKEINAYKEFFNILLKKHGIDFEYICDHPEDKNGVSWHNRYTVTQKEWDDAIELLRTGLKKIYKQKYYAKHIESSINKIFLWQPKIEND